MIEGGLAELHTHLGASVASEILWSLAHEQGIALPVKDYWEFDRLVTIADPRRVDSLDALDQIYHWTELIQSSPLAVERSVHDAIGGAYRSQGITTLELRFNPMKRNRGGERDLDHIIMAATRGLDRASLEYPQVRAGLILMMDRTFTQAQNEIIVEKAIRYRGRGIVGIDIAGPRPGPGTSRVPVTSMRGSSTVPSSCASATFEARSAMLPASASTAANRDGPMAMRPSSAAPRGAPR
jgi:adenosine deaminase